MYEQNEVPVFRRILWIVLWFVVIVAVLWLLVWLIFFRHPGKKPNSTGLTKPSTSSQNGQAPKDNSSGSQSSGSSSSSSNSGNSGSSSGSSSPSPTPSTPAAPSQGASTPSANTPATQPSSLANTGAGDVLIPFAVASIAGSAIYYVRIARKQLQ